MITDSSVVKKVFEEKEIVYFANAVATNSPFVVEDQETYNDQVWVFTTEEELKAYFEKNKEEKIFLQGKRLEKKNYPNFFYQLRTLGVNAVVLSENGEEYEAELDDLAPQPELSEEDEKKKPPTNPSLQLSAIYFMQEMRRPISMEEHEANGAREREQEVLRNVCKSNYFMILKQDETDPKKVGPILLKNKEEKFFLPLYTDLMEMAKFNGRGQGLKVVQVPFVKLKDLVPPQVTGITINPQGFSLSLTREQLLKLIG